MARPKNPKKPKLVAVSTMVHVSLYEYLKEQAKSGDVSMAKLIRDKIRKSEV